MLPENKFAPRGYIHNRKGFAVTSNGGLDIAYILNVVENPDNGTQLVIETLFKNGPGSKFKEAQYSGNTIRPVLPYRINLSDQAILDALNVGVGFSPQASPTNNTLPIFNPNMTLYGVPGTAPNLLFIHGAFGLNSQQGDVQLNITREQINSLNDHKADPLKIWKAFKSESIIGPNIRGLVSNFSYRADDTRASIIVKNNGTTDDLYISVTTTVTMTGKEGIVRYNSDSLAKANAIINGNTRTYSYSIPVLIKLSVTRSLLIGPQIIFNQSSINKPVAWRYLFDLNESSRVRIINPEVVGSTFDTHPWNYDLIPSRKYENIIVSYLIPKEVYYLPTSYGCMWDTVLVDNNLNNRKIVSISAIGEVVGGRKQQPITWQSFDLSSLDADLFAANTSGGTLGHTPETAHVPRICGDVNGDAILFAVSINDSKAETGKVNLYYFNSSFVLKSMTISDVISTCVCKSGATFAIGCDLRWGTFRLFKCPSLAVMLAWNNRIIDSSALVGLSFTDLGNTVFETTFAKKGFLPGGPDTVVTYQYNPLGEDKTILGSPNWYRGRFIREISNLVIESVAISDNLPIIFNTHKTDSRDKIIPITIPKGIASYGDSGGDSTDYHRFYTENNTLQIQSFDTQVLDINGTPGISYWVNPTFEIDTNVGGIKILFTLTGCTGIFRSGNGTVADWDEKLGGVPIDYTYTRPDIATSYGGGHNDFITVNGVGHYWAPLSNPSFTFSLKDNNLNELVHTAPSLAFTDYTTTGIFNIQIHTYLNLDRVRDDSNRTYTDPNFQLNNVTYNLSINTPDKISCTGTVTIAPPSPVAEISTTVLYKTIDATVPFIVTKDLFTSIAVVLPIDTGVPRSALRAYAITESQPDKPLLIATPTILGNWINLKYMPLYAGSRGAPSPLETRRITNVKGHKFHLENTRILIDNVDKTSEIEGTGTAWYYINTAGNINVEIRTDIKHEDFVNEAYSSPDLVYPKIRNTYMMVIPATYFPPASLPFFVFGTEKTLTFKEIPPKDSPLTYPNCSYIMANSLYQTYVATADLNKAKNSYGSVVELTGEALTAAVAADGKYHIYLIVEDEFFQRSAWCITNIAKNFNVPFKDK